jgi:hypothetical protein
MPTPDPHPFAPFIPGFDFLQNLSRQAAGVAVPGATPSALPGMPSMGHWVAPTFDVEELDRRIQDLRAVHFWLDQNTKALAATIQALEVQKMTLSTLKQMNVSMQDMADAFKIRPEAAAAPAPAPAPNAASRPEPAPEPEATAPEGATAPMVDPMQWWSALSQQFQSLAAGAMQERANAAPADPQAPPDEASPAAAPSAAKAPAARSRKPTSRP